MTIDHRMDKQLFEQNSEILDLNNCHFNPIKSVQTYKHTGKVYDLKIDKVKNYVTEVGVVHNGGRRKGAACVYLETHHPDIMSFLELRDNTGDPEKRSYNLNLANWIPDLFMERVHENGTWSLFDPSVAPELNEIFGDEYKARYIELEEEEKYTSQLPARKLYRRMMQTLAETGNGWMTWKDTCNSRCNSAFNIVIDVIEIETKCNNTLTFKLDDIVHTTNRGDIPAKDLTTKDILDDIKY